MKISTITAPPATVFNTDLVTLALALPAWTITYKLEIIYMTVGLLLFACVHVCLWLRGNADREDARQKALADAREDIHRYR
jgi:hypothetical protein